MKSAKERSRRLRRGNTKHEQMNRIARFVCVVLSIMFALFGLIIIALGNFMNGGLLAAFGIVLMGLALETHTRIKTPIVEIEVG
jgi:hypothetical protein